MKIRSSDKDCLQPAACSDNTLFHDLLDSFCDYFFYHSIAFLSSVYIMIKVHETTMHSTTCSLELHFIRLNENLFSGYVTVFH